MGLSNTGDKLSGCEKGAGTVWSFPRHNSDPRGSFSSPRATTFVLLVRETTKIRSALLSMLSLVDESNFLGHGKQEQCLQTPVGY